MNEYDIAIRETMEMTVTVEAASREEDRRMVEERWKTANISWTQTASGMWSSTPEAAAATGANDELFFRAFGIPLRGMECICTSKHRLCDTTKAAC